MDDKCYSYQCCEFLLQSTWILNKLVFLKLVFLFLNTLHSPCLKAVIISWNYSVSEWLVDSSDQGRARKRSCCWHNWYTDITVGEVYIIGSVWYKRCKIIKLYKKYTTKDQWDTLSAVSGMIIITMKSLGHQFICKLHATCQTITRVKTQDSQPNHFY